MLDSYNSENDYSHWRRQGTECPAPPNDRTKKKGRGYFYQMSNMYTCIAYLIEIRKFCSKTWFIKVLILRPKML